MYVLFKIFESYFSSPGDGDEENESGEEDKQAAGQMGRGDRSHLIVWQVFQQK